MTYLSFHLLFILPPLAIVAFLYRRTPQLEEGGMSTGAALAAICAIAFVYTTPWDNYLVWRGIWGYGPERVLGTVGYVPVEEYLFFILQPLLTGCFFFVLVARRGIRSTEALNRTARWTGSGVFFVLSAVGVWMLRSDTMLYLGLILTWAAPVSALQWAYAGARYWQLRRLLVPGVLAPTLYLWIVDRIAIGLEIWVISDTYTTGLHLIGLPIEEAGFFLMTNLLVVQGLILFVIPPTRPFRAATSGVIRSQSIPRQ